jgi:hypothetical protein
MYSDKTRSYASKGGQGELIIQSMITLEQLSFAAFLSGFSQSFKSSWNTENVYGRNDPIATFQGTVRSFSLSFDIPSPNLEAAKESLSHCNKLMQFLYPAYNDVQIQPLHATVKKGGVQKPPPISGGRIISHAPLVKVRFANLIRSSKPKKAKKDSEGLLGYLDGLEWAPDLEMGMFLDGTGNVYPKVINLSFGFNVLHQTELGYKQEKPQSTLYEGQSFFPDSPKKPKSSSKNQSKKTAVTNKPKTPKGTP